jgi:hypothetical protein
LWSFTDAKHSEDREEDRNIVDSSKFPPSCVVVTAAVAACNKQLTWTVRDRKAAIRSARDTSRRKAVFGE